ncbi:DUF4301 family protein [soil metagenome]
MFSPEEIKEIKGRGSDPELVKKQIENFKQGFPYLELIKAATIGDGILKVNEQETKDFAVKYEEESANRKIIKFVPASGAASRMFKDLFSFLQSEDSDLNNEDLSKNKTVAKFFERLKDFAFYDDLKKVMKENNIDLEESLKNKKYKEILTYFLLDEGLGYGELPKGLLKFHHYADEVRTPIQEHLVEGAAYTKDRSGKVYLHFTVSPEHKDKFSQHIEQHRENYEKKYGVNFILSFSEQQASTDTIAVDMNNKPFRNEDGSILFRPAGHGALIENLNKLEADIVFIKNIDNVVPDRLKDQTYLFKKVLGGILLKNQEKIFNYLEKLKSTSISKEELTEIKTFLEEKLCVVQENGSNAGSTEELKNFLIQKLNRPIRVCGMVKNEGEPGGGPFWARNPDDTLSLQIVESSQVDPNNTHQKDILTNATHFNPVDLVCGIKNFKGERFNLINYRNPASGFITQKSKDGKDLKAQELPGLWNGAMSDWNTIFLEVPIITFNPVKTVNDLLRNEHQN